MVVATPLCFDCGALRPPMDEDHNCIAGLRRQIDMLQIVVADLCTRHGPYVTGAVLEDDLKRRGALWSAR